MASGRSALGMALRWAIRDAKRGMVGDGDGDSR
jgi:hypothetical protein